jgi:hypothetical protein
VNINMQLNKRVLPVLLTDGVNASLLPPELQTIQYVDYRQHDRNALSQLSRALVHLPDAQPPPESPPQAPPVPLSPLGEIKALIDAETIPSETQASLILDLKPQLYDHNLRQDARRLLRQLRHHPDLRASEKAHFYATTTETLTNAATIDPNTQFRQHTPRDVYLCYDRRCMGCGRIHHGRIADAKKLQQVSLHDAPLDLYHRRWCSDIFYAHSPWQRPEVMAMASGWFFCVAD